MESVEVNVEEHSLKDHFLSPLLPVNNVSSFTSFRTLLFTYVMTAVYCETYFISSRPKLNFQLPRVETSQVPTIIDSLSLRLASQNR